MGRIWLRAPFLARTATNAAMDLEICQTGNQEHSKRLQPEREPNAEGSASVGGNVVWLQEQLSRSV